MYVGFYYTAYLYPNALTINVRNGEYFWLCVYFLVHISSMFYFVTAGNNPGFIQPDVVSGDLEEGLNLKTSDNGSVEESKDDIEMGQINNTEDGEEK